MPLFVRPEQTTLAPGETLRLHFSGAAPPKRLLLVRSGAAREAYSVPLGPGPPYAVVLPSGLRPGVYVSYADGAGSGAPSSLHASSGAALFVVRGARAGPVLFNVPLFTYHAYNVAERDPARDDTARACLYTGARSVSLDRPGGGIGGYLWDEANVDVYDRESPRQTWAHWDARAAAWLEDSGTQVDYCTDLDLHEDAGLLRGRRLLLCFGHHEYWTDAMRENVSRFVAAGGNVAFFGGNTLWFRVRYDAATRSIARAGAWPQPESRLTGLTYARGAGWWRGPRAATGYTVLRPDHWLFEGTGLRAGETFGAQERLIGYECDGIPEAAARPPALEELACADVGAWPIPAGDGEQVAGARASLVAYVAGGTVVNAGTVDWPRLLPTDKSVSRITANVLRRLG